MLKRFDAAIIVYMNWFSFLFHIIIVYYVLAMISIWFPISLFIDYSNSSETMLLRPFFLSSIPLFRFFISFFGFSLKDAKFM